MLCGGEGVITKGPVSGPQLVVMTPGELTETGCIN
jgi:hypothetical protein